MSTFSLAQGNAPSKPSHILVLLPSDFADDWFHRPTAEVAVGLRRICDKDRQIAASEAAKFVRAAYTKDGKVHDADLAIDEYNNLFMRWILASAMCDPNDVQKPYFDAAQDVIGVALTTAGILKVWAEYVKVTRQSDSSAHQADDEEIGRLGRLLRAGRLSQLEPGLQAEVRRLLSWCLDKMGDDDASSEDEEEGGYIVRTG